MLHGIRSHLPQQNTDLLERLHAEEQHYDLGGYICNKLLLLQLLLLLLLCVYILYIYLEDTQYHETNSVI